MSDTQVIHFYFTIYFSIKNKPKRIKRCFYCFLTIYSIRLIVFWQNIPAFYPEKDFRSIVMRQRNKYRRHIDIN